MARDYNNQVNFQEAVREYYRAYAKKDLSDAVQALLQAQREDENGLVPVLGPQNSDFE